MKKLIVILFLFANFVLFAQLNVDSLKNVIAKGNEQSNIAPLKELASFYFNAGNLDSAQILFNSILQHAIRSNNDSLLSYSYSNLGLIYIERDERESALENLNKALEYARKIGDRKREGLIISNTGLQYGKDGDYDKEIDYYNKSLKIAQEINDKLQEAIVYGNIGIAYFNKGYYSSAMEYILKSIQLSETIEDNYGVAFMVRMMGTINSEMKNFNKAIDNNLKAVEIFKKEGANIEVANTYIDLGKNFTQIHKLNRAKEYLLKAKNIFSDLNYLQGLAKTSSELANLYKELKKYDLALAELKVSLDYYTRTKNKSNQLDNFLLSAEIYINTKKFELARRAINRAEMLLENNQARSISAEFYDIKSKYLAAVGDYKSAYKFNVKLSEVRDSLLSHKSIAQISDLEVKYESEKQKKENEILKAENKLQALQQREDELLNLFSAIIIVLMVFLIGGLYARYRAKIKLNDKLRETNRTKDKVFSIIAHDLKNPFLTLLGYTDLLAKDYNNLSDNERIEAINSLNTSANYTFELLENLLNWARAQKGEIKLNPKNLNLNSVIEKSIEVCLDSAKNKNITITNLIDKNTTIFADEETISAVVRNLITNAIKFTHSSGRVTISSEINAQNVILTVEDNGIGIAKEKLSSLFTVNTQQSELGTNNEKGTGLGLLLCKEFISKNNGTISVESELNVGTKFNLKLPVS